MSPPAPGAGGTEPSEAVQHLARVNLQLDRKLQELNTLFDIGKALNACLERDKVLNLLLLTLLGQLAIGRGAVFLVEGGRLRLASARGVRGRLELDLPVSEVQTLRSPVRSGSGGALAGLLEAHRFALAVPMHMRGELQGLVCLGTRVGGGAIGPEHDEFLMTLAGLAAAALDSARLFAVRLAAKRLEEELDLARSIQSRLLPRQLPRSEIFDVAAISVPSRQVGGDYYDVIELGGDLRVAIGDVSGKGVPAALLMANVQAGLRVLRHEPDEVLLMSAINRLIHENTELPRFISLVSMRLSAAEPTLRYVNAGHNPPLLLKPDGRVRTLTEGGLLLGIFGDSQYDSESVPFGPGDRLVAYTDGITEAFGPGEEMFGEERLLQLLEKCAELSAAETVDRVREELDRFCAGVPQRDDLTLVVVRRS